MLGPFHNWRKSKILSQSNLYWSGLCAGRWWCHGCLNFIELFAPVPFGATALGLGQRTSLTSSCPPVFCPVGWFAICVWPIHPCLCSVRWCRTYLKHLWQCCQGVSPGHPAMYSGPILLLSPDSNFQLRNFGHFGQLTQAATNSAQMQKGASRCESIAVQWPV